MNSLLTRVGIIVKDEWSEKLVPLQVFINSQESRTETIGFINNCKPSPLCPNLSCCFLLCTNSSVLPASRNVSIYLCKPYHWESNAHETFQYLTETILGFLLPFSFILFCYISVICRLRSAMFQRKGRGNALILIIIVAFIIFWLPYHLINILQVSHTSQYFTLAAKVIICDLPFST